MQRQTIQDYVVSGQVDAQTFKSIKGLMVSSEFKDMSSFIKQALITRCHKITKEINDELIQELKTNGY